MTKRTNSTHATGLPAIIPTVGLNGPEIPPQPPTFEAAGLDEDEPPVPVEGFGIHNTTDPNLSRVVGVVSTAMAWDFMDKWVAHQAAALKA